MQLKSVLLFGLPLVNAAIVDLYEDKECKHKVDTRNVWDNSCAQTVGFQFMNITYPGGHRQWLSTFSKNVCIGVRTRACMPAVLFTSPFADETGCISTTNSLGGSNAISFMGPFCARLG
jgi:hypothetical protein